MKQNRLLMLAAFAAAAALAAPPAPDAPLMEDKGVGLTAIDFDAALSRVPENRQGEVRMSHQRIMTLLDTAYVARQLAAKAKDAGLDKDPIVQKRLQQAMDNVLADVYMTHVEKTAKFPDLEPRARELYRSQPDKFKTEEAVNIQHILVGLNGRTREMALERAKELRAELDRTGEDFLSMAGRVSDDPDRRKNGGDLGYFSVQGLEAPLVEAARKMKRNEVSQPIETRHGYHLIRLIAWQPATPVTFEAAKRKLIDGELDRLMKERRENVVKEVRESPSVVVHRDNIEKLRIDVDVAKLSREARERDRELREREAAEAAKKK
jgi:peptidyl-prolyl cis-trans isomerase C